MRTQEDVNQQAAELAERSRATSALAVEALKAQWLAAPNRTFVVEKKEKD
ncbi:hypothetical protein [Mycobacteroides abscessus]|nr:hypothetical protein [Mycobacteroides abscessus]SLJ13448.1 Uncharacterised protein [Mycobacteroides abscessus subsp. abscessus]